MNCSPAKVKLSWRNETFLHKSIFIVGALEVHRQQNRDSLISNRFAGALWGQRAYDCIITSKHIVHILQLL